MRHDTHTLWYDLGNWVGTHHTRYWDGGCEHVLRKPNSKLESRNHEVQALMHVPLRSLLSAVGRRKLSSLSCNSKLPSPAGNEKLPPLGTLIFLQWTFVKNNPANFLLSSVKEFSPRLFSRLDYVSHSLYQMAIPLLFPNKLFFFFFCLNRIALCSV